MWNNKLIFGCLLIATVCTQCQCIGYPKIKPDNPLELPTLNYDDKPNVITDSASQHASSTAQDIAPEQVPSDDIPDKVINVPQVHEDTHEDDHHHVNHPHHHGEDGSYNAHDDGTGWDIRKSIPGEPGRDYPTYVKVFNTSFTCGGKPAGYYADLESRCQIFRVCTTGSVNAFNSFLCPNGSLFNQAVLTCDWWPNVDCQGSASYYHKNNGLGHIPQGQQFMEKIREMLDAPILHPYKPVHEENNYDTPVTNNHLSNAKNYNNYQVTPPQNTVTVTETYSTTPVTYNTPKIHVSTFETISTTGPSIIESTQQIYTGHYDEKTQTNALVSHHGTTENINGNVLVISNEQVGGNSIVNHSQTIHHSTESSHAQTGQQLHLPETLETSLPLFTTETGTETNVTPGPLHLSHPKTEHIFFSTTAKLNHHQTASSEKHIGTHSESSSKDGHQSETLQTSLPFLTTEIGTETNVTPGPLYLSHPKTEHIFFSTTAKLNHHQTASSEKHIGTHSDSSSKDGYQLYTSDIHPPLKLNPIVANHNSDLSNKLFLSQNAPTITIGQNSKEQQSNIDEHGPEKISLLINEGQKQEGLVHQQQNVIGTIQTNSGLNIQKETSVKTNTVQQVVGGLNINNAAQGFQSASLNNGALNSQSDANKQTFTGISKSIELPHSTQTLQTNGGNIQQHYARILNNNEQSTQNIGSNVQNYQDQNIKSLENQQNQFANLFNQNTQSIQQQDLHNQALQNFVLQTQNIHNTGIKDFTSGIPQGVQVDVRNQGIESNFGQNLQNNFNAQNGINFNQGFTGETQNAGVHNQNQGILSTFGVQGQNSQHNFNTQNGFNFNQGFTGQAQNAGLQNQGFQSNFGSQRLQNQGFQSNFASQGLQNQGFQSNFGSQSLQNGYTGLIGQSQNQNLGSLNFGSQAAFDENAFNTQNGFISNQNGGVSASDPNFHEQNYQNFNFYSKNNGQNANYEISKNGAAQNYKGESLSQHVNGQTHSAYSGNNYAYKESTKVEVVPSLGFTLTDELGRASYASAVISGLVQEKRGASSANYAAETISPSDVRHSSYQGPSSYLVPQSSVQHLPDKFKRE